MRRNLGESINSFEWRLEVPLLLANRFDRVEDMYERCPGSRCTGYNGVFHNLAVSGFRVFDSFKIHDDYCSCQINRKEKWIEDDFLGLPSAPMYRIAQRVLNPGDIEERREWTQIRNLQQLNENEGGVENLILFLGANDCLGTVKDLKIKRMRNYAPSDPQERRDYNFTSVEVFESDYREMVRQISAAISSTTKVFVATIPHVTIPPITRGIGDSLRRDPRYFQHYVPFFIDKDDFDPRDRHLTGQQAWEIDQRINIFNNIIRRIVADQNDDPTQRGEWHIVDICELLDSLAVKRSGASDNPSEPLRQLLAKCLDHPLLTLPSPASVLLFESSNSEWKGGGFFSLDCFHPTTIGYGLIAEAFLAKMDKVGVNIEPSTGNAEDSEPVSDEDRELRDWNRLNWQRLIEKDTLIQDPPVLWDDIVRAARRNPRLAKLIYRVFS